jgi:xeroderma pigmentosum group C-complementing protein
MKGYGEGAGPGACRRYYHFLSVRIGTMDDDSDDEIDWEEITSNLPERSLDILGASSSLAPLEITINTPIRPPSPSATRRENSQADSLARLIRLRSHRIHTVALLASASIRNNWLNDDLLKVYRL